MRVHLYGLGLAVIVAATPASAHRLDEYLQAATIRLGRATVEVKVRLTPGVSVYRSLIGKIDTNGDGLLSEAEEKAYAEKVRDDLLLAVDHRPLSLRLVSWTFPSTDEMSQGTGEIVIDTQASLPESKLERALTLENHHEPAVGAYMVNCLVPADPEILIRSQNRSYDQSVYEIRFSTASSSLGVAAPRAPGASFDRWLDRADGWPSLRAFFLQGVRHILTGYDHLLFVGALVMAAASLWDLVKVVTAFTVAHTITLTLAALNLVHVPASLVEPLISASIVCVALQNLVRPGRAGEWSRLLPAFFFGLFHGLGFASGLLDAMRDLPAGAVLFAIVGFSMGVEAGHQMVVLPLYFTLRRARENPLNKVDRFHYLADIRRLASAAIAACGMYFFCTALIRPSS